MFDTSFIDSNGLDSSVSSHSLSLSYGVASGITPGTDPLLTPGFQDPLALSSSLDHGALNQDLDPVTASGDVLASVSPLFLFAQQASLTAIPGSTNTAVDENTQVSDDSLLGINTDGILVGSANQNLTADDNIRITSVASGTLDSTDPITFDNLRFRDDYLLTGLSAGEQVQVNLDANFDTFLVLLNANTGQTLDYNNNANGTLNSELTFTAQEGVNYLLRTTSFTADATGNYSLTTNVGTPIPATLIGPNKTVSGSLVSTDPINPTRSQTFSDNYLLGGVVPGQVMQVNMNATFDTYLQVVDANTGVVLASNDDASGSLNSQLGFRVEAGVNYMIRATSFGAETTGDYTLTTQQVTLPDNYDLNYGYGLVDAAAAVAGAVGNSPFPDVPNLGGVNWGLDIVNAPEVWAQGYTGQGVVVAVVDTGVDYTHPDLAGNIWVNSGEVAGNGIDDEGNGYIDDVRGWDFVDGDNNPMDLNEHGTHVAGTIAAENNDFGVTGVAYNATIMPVRGLSAEGDGNTINIAQGIRYAADNGANVINLSLGGGYSGELQNAIEYATERGAVVVMASGNSGNTQPISPAFLANQWGIAVGAIDANKAIAYFSNQAGVPALNYVVAPGVDVYSTTPNNTYNFFSGTSMATPHVAGVAALILSANPNLTPAEVNSLLTQTATRTGVTV
jgi:subtilisin family serine protease